MAHFVSQAQMQHEQEMLSNMNSISGDPTPRGVSHADSPNVFTPPGSSRVPSGSNSGSTFGFNNGAAPLPQPVAAPERDKPTSPPPAFEKPVLAQLQPFF